MSRKVIKHGPSTLIVSLPSKWARKNDIDKGDELQVEERGNEIIFKTRGAGKPTSVEVDVTELPPFLITRLLARSYQKGYDDIHIIHNDRDKLRTIQEKVQELIGYEIVEQNEKECIIKSISPDLQLDFDNSLKKAFQLVKQMIEACHEAYKSEKKESLKNLELMDLQVNRLCYFCLRQINKEIYKENRPQEDSHVLYYHVEILEDLGDAYKEMARHLSEEKVNKNILELMNIVQEQYEVSYDYFFRPNLENVQKTYDIYNQIYNLTGEVMKEELTHSEHMAILSLTEAADIIYHFTTMRLDFLEKMV